MAKQLTVWVDKEVPGATVEERTAYVIALGYGGIDRDPLPKDFEWAKRFTVVSHEQASQWDDKVTIEGPDEDIDGYKKLLEQLE